MDSIHESKNCAGAAVPEYRDTTVLVEGIRVPVGISLPTLKAYFQQFGKFEYIHWIPKSKVVFITFDESNSATNLVDNQDKTKSFLGKDVQIRMAYSGKKQEDSEAAETALSETYRYSVILTGLPAECRQWTGIDLKHRLKYYGVEPWAAHIVRHIGSIDGVLRFSDYEKAMAATRMLNGSRFSTVNGYGSTINASIAYKPLSPEKNKPEQQKPEKSCTAKSRTPPPAPPRSPPRPRRRSGSEVNQLQSSTSSSKRSRLFYPSLFQGKRYWDCDYPYGSK